MAEIPREPVAADEEVGGVPEFPVVAIGASAGGLESLERLFSRIPVDTGMAFIVLQHLSPDFKSVMDELLARRTSMPVRHAEHDTALEANAVYLLPPMKEMVVRHRRLLLTNKDPRHGLTLPIDIFFRSLAADIGERAIAVVLSGSGSDGSRGIVEVNKAGGVVFCESVDTAKFNGMPLSAIRTGVVDRVQSPEEIADAIAALARGGLPRASEEIPGMQAGADAILELLRAEYGIDFSHYKSSTVHRRIERRLALNRALDLDAYVDQVRGDPRELNSLYEDLLIGVTRFFRDDQSFQVLEERVIPEIVTRAKADPDQQIRVWVPGCATGQEAYSIAILFSEQVNTLTRSINVKILATDVHKSSLDFAGAGLYSEQQVADISPERRERFFTRKPNGFQVSQALREMIVFAPHNVIRDAPFTKLDLIACRNLLIYFQPHAQKTILTLFHFGLKPGGYLFLGSSESPRGLVDEFDTIDEHGKVYRKRRDIGLPRDLKLPLPRGGVPLRVPSFASARTAGVSPDLIATYDRLLDRFMPPSFLVDEHGVLVDTYGGVESMLKVKPRRPTQNLVEMLSDDLRTVISGALHRVKRDQETVRYEGLSLPGVGRYALLATPLRDTHGNVNHILFSLEGPKPFDESAHAPRGQQPESVAHDRDTTPAAEAVDLAGLSRDQVHALQDELSYTKENLQAAIQELETTNEELQATNEELIASNEELQSTNEELHSVNEELYTVNAEYQKKNVELQELNDDMEHLLNGTDVGTVFLDRALCIRKFTPRIGDVFRIIPDDVGRPIRSFSHDLRHPTLMADIERVLESGGSVAAETWDTRGRCYFLRILPYRARPRDNRDGQVAPLATGGPDGVLLTLTDISALEQARSRLAQLSAIVESSDDAIASVSLDGIVTSWNRGAAKLYGYTPEEAIGRHVSFVYPDGRKDEISAVLSQVRAGASIDPLETTGVRKDETLVDVSVTYSPILDSSDAVVGVSAISRDITQLARTRDQVADREERIRLLLDSTAEAIYGTDLSGVCTFCNAACARLLGYPSPAALIGKQIHRLIHHTRADGTPCPPDQSPIYIAMRHREPAHVDNDVLWRGDGTSFPAEYWCHPIVSDSEVIGAVVTFIDITERRCAEQELQEGVRRREQFLAMLSHELRNPLAAILSATHLLEVKTQVDEETCVEAGAVIARQARHMSRLLDDLLDVSRITRGRITLHKEHLDLRETSRSAIEALGPLMRDRRITLDTDVADEAISVLGDAARLQQIQANLLSNATKYSTPGSRVRFEVRREGNEALIRVSDHGRGIEPDLLPKIWDLFVQGPQTIARSDGGLGIGLTLLRSLVTLHDGRVDAHSGGTDKGSVFSVWLPLDESQSADAAEPDLEAAPAVKSVVVVEDQADARTMMKILLESKGFTVMCADNGLDGVALIEQVRPDVAIVDLGLPVMSGYELARTIRNHPPTAATPLIALSGYGQESDVRAALDAGFDSHLTKPPDFDRLDELIHHARRRQSSGVSRQ